MPRRKSSGTGKRKSRSNVKKSTKDTSPKSCCKISEESGVPSACCRAQVRQRRVSKKIKAQENPNGPIGQPELTWQSGPTRRELGMVKQDWEYTRPINWKHVLVKVMVGLVCVLFAMNIIKEVVVKEVVSEVGVNGANRGTGTLAPFIEQ